MKKIVLSFAMLFACVSSGVFAQTNPVPRIHQVGINFSSLNQFGIHYKTGNEKTLLRLSLLSLNLGIDNEWGRAEDSLETKHQRYGIGFRLGFEKFVRVVEHLDFIWGLEAGCDFAYNRQKNNSIVNNYERFSYGVAPEVNLLLGVTYTIADHLVLGAEITPYLQYTFGKVKTTSGDLTLETTTSSVGFGFNSGSASLSVAYRFGK